ncbi:hypothetical protein DOTSEDRAFT_39669 [Dothistroma septosporum NZE10]|uniref:Zn(2)-C6 fungal-type domain-containing protein n=1 Tax=Dothistroma septosporum (strain NZE10 / CBS 128990) TaxID=675120 RepID=M2WHR0_DOTSN|nr:hypothetical protein DOTSEDRAFT_39669 [Dothistroma septosporum NZE10]
MYQNSVAPGNETGVSLYPNSYETRPVPSSRALHASTLGVISKASGRSSKRNIYLNMARSDFGRRCLGCISQKKGCPGGHPCNSCVKRGIPCDEYIPNDRKRRRDGMRDGDGHDEGGSAPIKRATHGIRAPAAKKRRVAPAGQEDDNQNPVDPILGISSFKIPVIFENKWYRLCCVVQYRQDPESSCCTKLNGIFTLLDHAGAIFKVISIGKIEGYTIDKVGKAWRDELLNDQGCTRALLQQHAQYGPRGPRVGETGRVMQMIYDEHGNLRDSKGLQRNANSLSEDTIHYISLFKLSKDFRGSGLAHAALTAYFGALVKRKSLLACEPYVVLSPAAYREDHDRHIAAMKAARKTPKTTLEVENLLFKFYRTCKLEELFRGDRELEGMAISLAGRPVTRAAIAGEVAIISTATKAKMRYLLVEAAAACTGVMVQQKALQNPDDEDLGEAFRAIERTSTTYANTEAGQQIVTALLDLDDEENLARSLYELRVREEAMASRDDADATSNIEERVPARTTGDNEWRRSGHARAAAATAKRFVDLAESETEEQRRTGPSQMYTAGVNRRGCQGANLESCHWKACISMHNEKRKRRLSDHSRSHFDLFIILILVLHQDVTIQSGRLHHYWFSPSGNYFLLRRTLHLHPLEATTASNSDLGLCSSLPPPEIMTSRTVCGETPNITSTLDLLETDSENSKIQAKPSALLALPDEILLQICKDNCPNLNAMLHFKDWDNDHDEYYAYLSSHMINRRMYDIALDAFFHDFVLEIHAYFHCFENKMCRWIKDCYNSCELGKTVFRGRITKARIQVDFEHAGFKKEIVERVMKVVMKLARETGLRELEILIETDDLCLSGEVAELVFERVKYCEELAGIAVTVAIGVSIDRYAADGLGVQDS